MEKGGLDYSRLVDVDAIRAKLECFGSRLVQCCRVWRGRSSLFPREHVRPVTRVKGGARLIKHDSQ